MIPILYDKLNRTFSNDYIGFLTDAVSCKVTEGRNDEYELEMVYPINGRHYADIEQDAIIKAKPNNQDEAQPFRIYRITKTSKMIVTIYARHIVYDLSKVTVEPFESTGTIEDAIAGMMENAIPSCGFIFETDKTTIGSYKVTVPSSFRSLMGGVRGSLLDAFGTAEYHYDGYNIDLLLNRGADHGVTIKYGVNLIDMEQEEACDNVYTAVYPFWIGSEESVYLTQRIISVDGEYSFSRVMALDLSSEFNNKPTEQQLEAKARQYITDHDIGIPTVSLDVDFTGTEAKQDINLCDIVTVDFEKIGVSATAKCISLTYDVLSERVTNVKLGNYKNTFIDTVYDQTRGITQYQVLDASYIEDTITGLVRNEEGYVLFHSTTNNDRMDEVLILTGTDKLNLVQKLWRWNSGGLAYSKDGYGGPYETAITADGKILASAVKTGTLVALQINRPNSVFYVSSAGFMKATSGYIGSTTTGFNIEGDSIWNTNIKLYEKGVSIRNGSKVEFLNIGLTEFIHEESEINSYVWRFGQDLHLQAPGIGMLVKNNAMRIGFYYYDSNLNSNYALFYYQNGEPESGWTARRYAFNIFRGLNVNVIKNALFFSNNDPFYLGNYGQISVVGHNIKINDQGMDFTSANLFSYNILHAAYYYEGFII